MAVINKEVDGADQKQNMVVFHYCFPSKIAFMLIKAHLCSTLDTGMGTDGASCPYSTFILFGFLSVSWKLADMDEM